jgi:hypothetical protein
MTLCSLTDNMDSFLRTVSHSPMDSVPIIIPIPPNLLTPSREMTRIGCVCIFRRVFKHNIGVRYFKVGTVFSRYYDTRGISKLHQYILTVDVPKQCPEVGIFARHRNNRICRSNRHCSNKRVLYILIVILLYCWALESSYCIPDYKECGSWLAYFKGIYWPTTNLCNLCCVLNM